MYCIEKFIYTGDIYLHSPYFLTLDYTPVNSVLQYLRKNLTIKDICELLMYPPDINPQAFFQESFNQVYIRFLRYVLSDFLRKNHDIKYPHFKMERRMPKNMKEHIRSESQLLGQLWKLIKLLPEGTYDIPLSLVFYKVIQEYELVLFIFRHLEPNEKLTFGDFKRIVQKQNKLLTTYEHDLLVNDATELVNLYRTKTENKNLSIEIPFNNTKSPTTTDFINRSQIEAGKNDSFRKEYNKLVSFRQSLATKIFESHPDVRKKGSNKIERRGRRH